MSIVTNPYRPPVGKTTPNNVPLIVKGSKVLPARQGRFNRVNIRDNGGDSQVETTYGVPGLYQGYY